MVICDSFNVLFWSGFFYIRVCEQPAPIHKQKHFYYRLLNRLLTLNWRNMQ